MVAKLSPRDESKPLGPSNAIFSKKYVKIRHCVMFKPARSNIVIESSLQSTRINRFFFSELNFVLWKSNYNWWKTCLSIIISMTVFWNRLRLIHSKVKSFKKLSTFSATKTGHWSTHGKVVIVWSLGSLSVNLYFSDGNFCMTWSISRKKNERRQNCDCIS